MEREVDTMIKRAEKLDENEDRLQNREGGRAARKKEAKRAASEMKQVKVETPLFPLLPPAGPHPAPQVEKAKTANEIAAMHAKGKLAKDPDVLYIKHDDEGAGGVSLPRIGAKSSMN